MCDELKHKILYQLFNIENFIPVKSNLDFLISKAYFSSD